MSRVSNLPLSNNADLIDIPGGRTKIDTPCLLVDSSLLNANIRHASELVAATNKTLSPHFKAHKTPQIAALQTTAGAAGFCVASIGEAEVMAPHVVVPLTITSAVVTDRQMARIAALAARVPGLTVVVDTSETIQKLSDLNTDLSVLIDIDMGRGRSACVEEKQAVQLAQEIILSPSLRLSGLQCYAGQLSHMNDFSDREQQALQVDMRAVSFLEAVKSVSEEPLRCTGGSTGASPFDLVSPALTDLQWGSYTLMDVEYNAVAGGPNGTSLPFQNALRVATRVISSGHKGHVITDAGDKRFASKYGAMPKVAVPEKYSNGLFRPVSDEHGEIRGTQLPRLGEIIEVFPPHCDPTINLFDVIHVVEGDTLVDIWPIAARGVY